MNGECVNMAITEDAALVGRTGLLAIGGMRVGVTIVDVKRAYGRVRYAVSPLSGSDDVVTVESNRVVIQDEV